MTCKNVFMTLRYFNVFHLCVAPVRPSLILFCQRDSSYTTENKNQQTLLYHLHTCLVAYKGWNLYISTPRYGSLLCYVYLY